MLGLLATYSNATKTNKYLNLLLNLKINTYHFSERTEWHALC